MIDDLHLAGNRLAAYNRLTDEEKAKHAELIKLLDAMPMHRRNLDRRQKVCPIDFEDRRIGDRRK